MATAEQRVLDPLQWGMSALARGSSGRLASSTGVARRLGSLAGLVAICAGVVGCAMWLAATFIASEDAPRLTRSSQPFLGISLILLGSTVMCLCRPTIRSVNPILILPVAVLSLVSLLSRAISAPSEAPALLSLVIGAGASTEILVVLAIASATLLSQSTSYRLSVRSPTLGLVGIIILGFGGAMVFGYASDLRLFRGSGPVTSRAFVSAAGLMALGIGISSVTWEAYRSVQRTSHELWRAIILYFTASALVITVMTSFFVALPFHQHIQEEIEEQLVRLTESKAQTLEQYFSLVRELSMQTSRSLDRSARGERLDASKITESLSPYIQGVARVSEPGSTVISAGSIPSPLPHIRALPGAVDSPIILGLKPLEGTYAILVSVRRRTESGEFADLFSFSTAPMKRVLRRDAEQSRISEIFFGNVGNPEEIFTYDARGDRFSTPFVHMHPYLSQLLREVPPGGLGRRSVTLPDGQTRIAAHSAVPRTGFFLLSTADERELHSRPILSLLEFTSWGVILSLIIALGSFVIVRELIVHLERSQDAAKSATRLKEAIVSVAPDAVFTCTRDGRVQSLNPSARSIFGITSEDLFPTRIGDVLRDGAGKPFLELLEQRADGNALMAFQCIGRTAKGADIPLECAVSRLELGEESLLIVFARDVTQQRQAESAIRSSLQEKDLLLREIHHRVKNNLQVISSLLALQSTSVEGVETVAALQESHSRVRSIALIHEHLYQSQSLAALNFGNYLERLCDELLTSLNVEKKARMSVRAAHVPLSVDYAIPCGLLVTELVTNSLKHAFPGDREGNLLVEFEELEPNRYRLVVQDNGVGYPAEAMNGKRRSLGLKLIERLGKQIGAEVTSTTASGTRNEFRFSTSERKVSNYGQATHSGR